MEFYTGPKGSGKTTLLIKKSAETGATIVCRDNTESERIMAEAFKMCLYIPRPLTYEVILRGYYSSAITGLLIDDLHGLFDQITNIPILAVTGRTEE